MIIHHENLSNEAEQVANILRRVYGIKSSIEEADLGNVFKPLPKFNAVYHSPKELETTLGTIGKVNLIITPRDLYC